MTLWTADKIMNRLDAMLDHAMNGEPIEAGFDETKMSAIETKLARYLADNQTGREKLREEKGRIHELISDISHQTKTPVANIRLYTELLKELAEDEESQKLIDTLYEQTEKLNMLIADLVKVSRLESGIISTSPHLQAVSTLLIRVMAEADAKAEAKNIELSCEESQEQAVFDLKWTIEAVFNIVDNAIKYTPTGGQVHISVTGYQMFTRIDIKDSGIGIREEEIPKIFGRFYRSADVSKEEGVGLGLYLAREIIASQNGYIKAASRVGEGSTFSVFLPTGR